MPQPLCNSACQKVIIDAMLEVHHRTSRAKEAASLGADKVTLQDATAFADACKVAVAAADRLSAAAGFPALASASYLSPLSAEPPTPEPQDGGG